MRILASVIGVGVIGASGYAGGELLRLIDAHPSMELVAGGANERAGQPITAAHPHLLGHDGRCFVANDADEILESDMVLIALPHGKSGRLADVIADVPSVIDLGADHRLRDAAQWNAYYGDTPHSAAWVYGLPEMPGQRAAVSAATRVANPGCYATAIQLAAAPLMTAGVLDGRPLAVVAASGTTGAGRKMTEQLLASAVMGSVSAYRVGGVHQHTPEVEQGLADVSGVRVKVCFTPLLAPMARGIIATVVGSASDGAVSSDVTETLIDAYRAEPFVTVIVGEAWPTTGQTIGTNQVIIRGVFDERTRQITVVAALDNLGKGAAGQAIQNANLMLGLPEGLGLAHEGVWP